MNYRSMDFVPNGMIVSNIEKSEIVYVNKKAKEILKIGENDTIKSVSQFITNAETFETLKNRIVEDNKKYGKSEGIVYLKALDGTFLEVSFCCIYEDEEKGIVNYIFKKATEVVGESQISFKELAEHLPSGIIVMDIENELSITYANSEHYKILGIDNEKVKENDKFLLKDFIFEEDLKWVITEIYENLSQNKDVDIEFRMKTQGDVEKWVRLYGRASLSSTGEKLFYSSLKDLSQRRHIHDKLHMERVLFHKITELTDEIIFRLDIQSNIVHFLGKKNEVFGEVAVFENYMEALLKLNKIYIEDIHIYKDMVKCFEEGIEKPIELRYQLSKNEFEWYKITYSFIRNGDGKPLSVIGKLTNIHSQKLLEEQARTDLLTNFYNKMTTEHEVNRLIRLKNTQSHAFFIIDIDNFKAINDNLGHHFGDMVLSDIANDIRGCFRTKDILGRIGGRHTKNDSNEEISIRKKDILGRIGGDEFIVVMRDVADIEVIFDKAQIICSILDKTFSNDDNSKNYSISASVGISLFPKDGGDYESLYKKADVALYDIKKTGKNGYKLYSPELNENQKNYNSKKLEENGYKVQNINTMVVSTVLNLLYETRDLSTSIQSILKYLGNIYKVDRCYIFEATDTENTYNNRYKWNSENATEDVVQVIDNAVFDTIFNKGDTSGIFYSNDIDSIDNDNIVDMLQADNVKSIFLVESLKNDSERLILGLEDCTIKREWTKSEVATLLHIGRLLFMALLNDNSNKLMLEVSKTSLLDYSNISKVINEFHNEKDNDLAGMNLIINMIKMFNIDKVTSMIYNEYSDEYLKNYECTENGIQSKCADKLSEYYRKCVNTLNHKVDDRINGLLDIANGNKYFYTDDFSTVKEELEKAGFISSDQENIQEVFIFIVEHKSFFGYMVFEKYKKDNMKKEKLTPEKIDMLTALCDILDADVAKMDLMSIYKDELYIKDAILKNEKTPMAVIEKDTFKILYHNDLYYSIFPNIEVGAVCYKLKGYDKKCSECCIDGDLLMNDANHSEHQWIKKSIPFTLNNGKEAYLVYSKDSIDYVKQVNALDNLTQALLYRGFEEYYKNFILNSVNKYALCTLDVDKFKYINDMFGYATGDSILKKIATVISEFITKGENFCRINEDKFAIFLRYSDEEELNIRAREFSHKFDEMKEEHFKDIKITIMGGVTIIDKELDLNVLIDQSTTARKSAKGSHMNNFAYYDAEIDSKIKMEMKLEERIPYAIKNNEFVPFLQPKFDLKTQKICGAEALVRWITDDGMIYPDQFIPLFERNGFILTLDFIIYEKVMEYIRKCLDNDLSVYPISVNVSRSHIKDKDFMVKFKNLIKEYRVPLEYLELEITESVFVEDKKELIHFVDEIKDSLLKVSIDDFGTAYSSLQNLTDIDVDVLKIDKGFLDNVDTSADIITKDEILIKNIINLAKELDFNVICEGVETNEQIELLKKVGCEYGQGYVFAKPMSIEDYEKQFLND